MGSAAGPFGQQLQGCTVLQGMVLIFAVELRVIFGDGFQFHMINNKEF